MTRLTELLLSKESLRVMALLPPKNELAVEQLSLFERFSLICENLYLLKNNFLSNEFLLILNEELDLRLSCDISMDREYQKQLWRAVFSGEEKELLADIDACVYNIDYAVCDVDTCEFIDLIESILSSENKELELFIEDLVACDKSSFFIDMSSLIYTRPDPYHASVAYQRIQNRDFSKDDIAILVAWCLSKALVKRNSEIYLKVKDNISDVLKLIELLRSRKITSPAYICIDPVEVSDVNNIAYRSFDSNVSDIYFAILGEDEEALRESAIYFPMNRIRQFRI